MIQVKNILLVEDDEDDQYLFIEALKEVPNTNLYAVANNGAEALDMLHQLSPLPDLIFMDVNMPLLNGIECLEAIAKKPLIKHIPVVMLTTDLGSIELLRRNGAKAFIKKPTNTGVLIKRIEEIIHLNFEDDGETNASFPVYS